MDKTISRPSDYREKRQVNRVLLNHINNEFPEEIMFTGGTSLMERGIIPRMSDDIDLISLVSRKKVVHALRQKGYTITATEDGNGSMISQYDVVHHSDEVKTRLDIVNFKRKYPTNDFSDLDNGDIRAFDFLDNKISCKDVTLILIDKICAIIEDIEMINGEKTEIRSMRHYFDIFKICTMSNSTIDLESTRFRNLLELEITKRLNTSEKFKANYKNVQVLVRFIENKPIFNANFQTLQVQLFPGEKLPTYEEFMHIFRQILREVFIIFRKNNL